MRRIGVALRPMEAANAASQRTPTTRAVAPELFARQLEPTRMTPVTMEELLVPMAVSFSVIRMGAQRP
jgi:hypothetical protein